MAKELEIKVEKDHIEALTKASGVSALSELIWNSLDADATNIDIEYKSNNLSVTEIKIKDDGHGMDYHVAETAFESLGGSNKKNRTKSPGDRVLHGKEGKGRLKVFSIGHLITFKSTVISNGKEQCFEIQLDRNEIKKPTISSMRTLKRGEGKNGVEILIKNIDNKNANAVFSDKGIKDLEEKFAVYYMSYPVFRIAINGKKLDFTRCIKNQYEENKALEIEKSNGEIEEISFKFKIIEWSRQCDKKLYYCSEKGISFLEEQLGIRTGDYQITVHILSDFIEQLHRKSDLITGSLNDTIKDATILAKDIARKYIRNRKHEEAKGFIAELKREGIYPFPETAPKDKVEEAERQVFDIVALQLNEHMAGFSEQDNKAKQLTLLLIKEVMQNDTNGLQKILEEVINLPQSKRDELTEILEKTSLSTIVDTMKEISDRLRIIYELKLLLFDENYRNKILERKHLHKIVKNETWIFGDDYTYGADDVNLKNVLKSYLKYLERENFEEIVEEGDNSNLNEIPDICLWKQYNMGLSGYFRNLVIELKRPSKTAGIKELDQIKGYARAIAKDDRFPKEKTKWIFILLVTDMNDDAISECNQRDRSFGHIDSKDNYDVYVKKWGELLNEADARHQYLKIKLNYNIEENEEGLSLLKSKHSEYLPEEIFENNESN
jgi:hypothetical protein